MKYLRQCIRSILLEVSAKVHKGGIVVQKDYDKERHDRFLDMFTTGLEYKVFRKDKDLASTRRALKQYWYAHADQKFWQNPKRVCCIHTIGLYKKQGSIQRYFGGSRDPAKIQKDELSCFAITKPTTIDDPGEHNYKSILAVNNNNIFFTVAPRFVTFAAADDSWTEELHRASDADKEYYRSSGLPKRPQTLKNSLYDSADISKIIRRAFGGGKRGDSPLEQHMVLGEVIVDNWQVAKVFLPRASMSAEQLQDNMDDCEELGIKYKVI